MLVQVHFEPNFELAIMAGENVFLAIAAAQTRSSDMDLIANITTD
jgi:hypothetical protein